MNKKTICILSYQRTGSSWLCDILSGDSCISLQEIFSKDPMIFIDCMSQILDKIYCVKPSIINTFKKIYNKSHFFVDSTNYIKIKQNILNNKPYNIKLLTDIQEISYQNNYNIVFKIFPEHLDLISLEEILKLSDYIILNYRNSLLNSFISEKKSLISQRWTSLQTERPYLEKIQWDENEYKLYANKIIKQIEYYVKNISNTKYVELSYEEIHTSKNKIHYIQNKLNNIYENFNWNFKKESILQKENYIKNIEKNFLNEKDFLESYKNLNQYLKQ